MPDNHYRIEGCGFGLTAGELRLEPEANLAALGSQPRALVMQLDSPAAWNDQEIDVHLDSRLAGIPDWPVTLVLRTATGHVAQLGGGRFVAAREPRLLSAMAASWVTLSPTTTSIHPISQLEFMSPPFSDARSANFDDVTALVIRSDADAFSGGEDFYDFSRLNPGWAVESVQVERFSMNCPGDVIRVQSSGRWDTSFDARGVRVSWASSSCQSFVPPAFGFTMSFSEYAIKVWVVGPAGTRPTQSQF